MVELRVPTERVSPDYPPYPSSVPCPLPRRTEQGHMSIACRSCSLPLVWGGSAFALALSRPAQASLALRPAGSLSRHYAAFVTRLQFNQLPGSTARQLPDQSTTIRMEPASIDKTRRRGAPTRLHRTPRPRSSVVTSASIASHRASVTMANAPHLAVRRRQLWR